jgi:hypothetical protein
MMILIGALHPENGAGFAFDESPGLTNVNEALSPMQNRFPGYGFLPVPC